MGAGLINCTAVTDLGGGQYECTLDSSSGMAANDHVGAELADGTDAIYNVASVDSATKITLGDTLTEGNASSVFGAPATGTYAYATPRGGMGLSRLPEGAKGWRAMTERNFAILDAHASKHLSGGDDALTASLVEAVVKRLQESGGPTDLALGAVADGQFLKRSGASIVGDTGSTPAHASSHASGGADELTASMLIEASVKRILEGSGNVLVAGSIADGQFLKRSGLNLVGANALGQNYILIRDEKATTTDGQGLTGLTWNKRDLNTEVEDTGGNASIASSQVTLDAGTYRIRAWAIGYDVDRHRVRWRNVTDGTTAALGTPVTAATADITAQVAPVAGRFTISASKVFEIQHYVQSTNGTNGGGLATSDGESEIYAVVELIKES